MNARLKAEEIYLGEGNWLNQGKTFRAVGKALSREKPYVIACIPAFNEKRTMASVVIKAMRHIDKVIVCDDGSTDPTGEIAEKLGK